MKPRTAAETRAYRKTPSGAASIRKSNNSPARKEYMRAHAAKPESRAIQQKYKALKRSEVRDLVRATKSKPCMDCGGTFDPVCMDFDHRPGELKSFTIGATSNRYPIALIRIEIAKCDVVCANCHRIRTHVDRDHRIASTSAKLSPQLTLIGEGATITVDEWRPVPLKAAELEPNPRSERIR